MRHFLTGSQAEFHDPFLRRLLAKYARKVTGNESIYNDILNTDEAFFDAVAKYKNVVTHFFAFKNEMWITTIVKNAFGIHDVFGVYEFAKGRGAIHTHFAGLSSSEIDELIDKVLSALACDIYFAFKNIIEFLDKMELEPTMDPRNSDRTPKQVMAAIREILGNTDGGAELLEAFDNAVAQREADAAHKLGELQAKHYGLSATHIGHAPSERVEPASDKKLGHRWKHTNYMTKAALRKTKPLQRFKFLEEDNLYCRSVGIQNYCFDHECNDYCLVPEEKRVRAEESHHGTRDNPASDPNIVRWHDVPEEGGPQYITYRFYCCRMGYGYKLFFPRKGSYTKGLEFNPRARIEYDKNGSLKIHMPRNHHKVVQEPVTVFHWGANADIQRLYVNEELHKVLDEKDIDLEDFMHTLSMLGRAGLDRSMASDMVTNYITSYQCKGRESSKEFLNTVNKIYDEYLEAPQSKTVSSYIAKVMHNIASGSDFSKDEALFLTGGGQLTFNTRRTRPIILHLVSFDDLRSRDEDTPEAAPDSGRKEKSFTIEALTDAYANRDQDQEDWNLYEFCSERIAKGLNGVPSFKGTKGQFNPSWPLTEEFALTQLSLFKPHPGKNPKAELKDCFDDDGVLYKVAKTYREALEEFMFDKKFPKLITSKILRAKTQFKFADDAGHEFNVTKEYLSPTEDRDVPTNTDAILAAESDDEADDGGDYCDADIDMVDIDKLHLPNPADIDWSVGYDNTAAAWLPHQTKEFYKKWNENTSDAYVPLEPTKYRPEKARGFAQHFLIALTILHKTTRDKGGTEKQVNVVINGKPGAGKTWIQSTQLNVIRNMADSDQSAAVAIAPTGCAASLLNGSTVHRFAKIPTGKDANKPPKDVPRSNAASISAMEQRMKRIFFLTLDEYSMLGRSDLAHLGHRTSEMRKETQNGLHEDFGGIPWRQFCGDVHQLPPVCKKGIHDTRAANKPRSACAIGRVLVQKMLNPALESPNVRNLVMVINAVQRQKGELFKGILHEMREGGMTLEMADALEKRLWSGLSPEEREECFEEGLFLMPTWKRTKPITLKYLQRLNKAPVVIEADVSGVTKSHHLAEMKITKQVVLMEGATVMLTKNFMIEDEVRLYNGAIGKLIGFGYPNSDGPLGRKLPDYVLVDFPNSKLPESYDCEHPNLVPIPVTECFCDYKCCTVRTIPLIVYKASSVHKAQGLSIGEGQKFKKVIVGVGGRKAQPGLDLVAFSRAQELTDLVIYDEGEENAVTKRDLLDIGRGSKYASKREFEKKLEVLQAQTVPRMIHWIRKQDTKSFGNSQRTFAGGVNRIFHAYYNNIGVDNPELNPYIGKDNETHAYVDLRKLGKDTNAWLEELPLDRKEYERLIDPLDYNDYSMMPIDPLDKNDLNALLEEINETVFLPRVGDVEDTDSSDDDSEGSLVVGLTEFGYNSYVGREIASHRFYTFSEDLQEDFQLPYIPSNTGRFFLPAYASKTRRGREGMPTSAIVDYIGNYEIMLPRPYGDHESDWFRVAELTDLREYDFVYKGCVYLQFANVEFDGSEHEHLVMLPFQFMQSYQSSSQDRRQKMFNLLAWLAANGDLQDDFSDLLTNLIAPRGLLGEMRDVSGGWAPLLPITTTMDHHIISQSELPVCHQDSMWPNFSVPVDPEHFTVLDFTEEYFLLVVPGGAFYHLPTEYIDNFDAGVFGLLNQNENIENSEIVWNALIPHGSIVVMGDENDRYSTHSVYASARDDHILEVDGGEPLLARRYIVEFGMEDFYLIEYNELEVSLRIGHGFYHLTWSHISTRDPFLRQTDIEKLLDALAFLDSEKNRRAVMNVLFPRGMIAVIGDQFDHPVEIASSRRLDLDILRATQQRNQNQGNPVVPRRIPPLELRDEVINEADDNNFFLPTNMMLD